jgi:very-short-patch-repair endonuclease
MTPFEKPLSRHAARADLSLKGRGKDAQYVGGGKSLPRRIPTSPLMGEVGARSAAGEGALPKKDFARKLRTRMTDAETKLWQELRAKRFENYKFRRQAPIGKYIADFVCYERKLIVEVDGSQHRDSQHDSVRGLWLGEQGYRVLRLWNRDVLKDMNGALLSILDALERKP